VSKKHKAKQRNAARVAALAQTAADTAAGRSTGANGLLPASLAAYDASVTLTEPTMRVVDAFSNPAARLGFGTQNLLEASQYPLTRLSQNYMLLNSLYRGNWIVQNIIGAVPEDMVKKWFRVTTKAAPEYIDKIDKQMRQTKLRQSIVEGLKWGRLYGGAVGLILIDGQDNLDEPLDFDKIMPDSFRGLYIVDRWSGVYPDMQLISDITDPDFGLPEYYEIRNEYGVMTHRVHHTRVVRFIGRELPFWERIVEQYWGQSEIESIYDEIVRRDNVAANIASLTFRANLSVYEKDNLEQLFALGATKSLAQFWKTLQAQSVLESNLGVKLINKGDNLRQLQYTFTGLAEVYENVMMDVAGAARIPVTKLFGRSPAGLNATGESDLQNYYDYIEEQREAKLRPVVERLLPVMALSAWGEIPDDLDVVFEPVRTPKEDEKATIAQKKVAALIEVFNANGMTQEAFMKELKALTDTSGLFANISEEMVDEGKGVWARDLQAMNDPFAGLMGTGAGGAFNADDYRNEPEAVFTGDEFNPNQPRDPDGKFAGEGGGSGGGDRGGTSERAKSSIRDAEAKLRSLTDHEEGYIITQEGKTMGPYIGDEGSVEIPPHLSKDNHVTHNHPGGRNAFSRGDVRGAVNSDVYELRAVTPNGRFVSITRGDNGWDSSLPDEYTKAGLEGAKGYPAAADICVKKYGPGKFTGKQMDQEHSNIVNEWMRDNAERFGYTFREGKI
jgi:phage-related protein (TIGR01555 family)